jgi:hypothetical protein
MVADEDRKGHQEGSEIATIAWMAHERKGDNHEGQPNRSKEIVSENADAKTVRNQMAPNELKWSKIGARFSKLIGEVRDERPLVCSDDLVEVVAEVNRYAH